MDLAAIYDKEEDIPESIENFRELFAEKNGKWECTGIKGMKTQADVDRLQKSLHGAQEDNKSLKGKLKTWDGWDQDETQKKLDRIEELEAAGADKLDDAKIDELANKRADGILRTKVAPLEREIRDLTKVNGELKDDNGKLNSQAISRSREDMLRPLMVDAKILPEHYEDVFLYSERHLERTEDGKFITRDGITNVSPGSVAKDWLTEILERRPGWLPPSVGGGSRGSGPGGSMFGGKNPFSLDNWNATEQGTILKEKGREHCDKLAKAAGTTVGGGKPKPKKTATA